MRKTLSILLISVALVSTISCSREFTAAHNIKLNATQTNESNIKDSKECPQLTTEENTYNTSEDSSEVNSSKTLSTLGTLLVNRSHRLKNSYTPQSLRIPNIKFISYANSRVKKMHTTAADALENLFNAAKENGITLLGVSGYRDYSYQKRNYDKRVLSSSKEEADKYVAQPNASEHRTGLAIDILSDEYRFLDEGFEKTEAYNWLESNCYKYGFILRYPKGKENITGYNYEPWHIRYVGISEATEISQRHITLEEYLNKVK
ncbi:M15 family metallopeptidase [Clostridium sp. MB40-C1]|uniref:M15 family metallopeptidase n=1 Tax=Clostridium sp. MB40-C1 TaxID=3070996 RepID=UPI0027DFBB23|nr:M15 family metallopeptidase [Clostridium sp. MB40-C1]WMJ81693.1 M15 family metallopeptidase [Clostridium sp. MB40-C1]